MQISTKAVELVGTDRKKVIIERALSILPLLSTNPSFGIREKLSSAYYIYKKNYNENLNIRELTILYLYTIFPDDERFIEMLNNTNYNFEKVAGFYSMSSTIARLRYDCYISLKNIKKLELK